MYTKGPWTYTGYDDHCQVGKKYHEILDVSGFEIINQHGIITNQEDAHCTQVLHKLPVPLA